MTTQETAVSRIKNNGYVLVVGLGRSGDSIARFLKQSGESVVVTDSDPARKEAAESLEKLGIRTEIGYHSHDTFQNARKIVTSPGIPLTLSYFKGAIEKGVPVTGELDLVTQYLQEPIVAVTGTNGKTTVVTLISELLKASGLNVFTGGNIGTPLVEYFMRREKADVVVAEISSFQLDTATGFAPDVGVLLNIAEDHLDRYPDFSAYEDSKWSLFRHQSKNDKAVVNADMINLENRIRHLAASVVLYGRRDQAPEVAGALIDDQSIRIPAAAAQRNLAGLTPWEINLSDLRLKGRHNAENIAASVLASLLIKGDTKAIDAALKTFEGLAHRIQYAGTINGVDFYNDSKATNPDAVMRALESFEKIILIMGGRSKATDFSCLAGQVKARVKTIVAIGEARLEIKDALEGSTDILEADSMAQAVETAYFQAKPGDTVMLSPACASFDMYKSYVHRGEDFIQWVKLLGKKHHDHG